MFEKMRESAAALRLKSKTDLVIDSYRHYRRRAILRDNHAQAVGQRRMLYGNLEMFQSFLH